MQAKVLAPAATKTEFGKVANDVTEYDYDKLLEHIIQVNKWLIF